MEQNNETEDALKELGEEGEELGRKLEKKKREKTLNSKTWMMILETTSTMANLFKNHHLSSTIIENLERITTETNQPIQW